MSFEYVGNFEVMSNKVYVSDPCYSPGTWCQGVLNGVKNGKWKVLVERTDEDPLRGSRIKEFTTHHESYDIEHLSDTEVEQ